MEGDQQLEAEASHPKQETIFCSPSLAQTYLTGVVDDTGQRDIFTVAGALDHVLLLCLRRGHSLLGRLLILLSLCENCRALLFTFTWRSCRSPSPPLPSRLALFKTFISAWPQTYPLFSNSLLF